MDKDFKEIVLFEIRENRRELKEIKAEMVKMDRNIFSNKIKLSIFMGSFTLFFSFIWTMIIEKVRTFF